MRLVTAALLAALMPLAACGHAGDDLPDISAARVQKVSVNTPGVTGAHCFLHTGGTSYSVSSPGTVNVRPASEPLDVTCFKGPHMMGNTVVQPTIAPREAGKGFACRTCSYPENVSVVMALNARSLEKNSVRQWP